MHPHLRRQHTTMFLQVKPRTSERDEAPERGYERWWFPPCSQPRRNVLPGDGIASVTVCPGTTGAWPGLLRGVNIDQVAAVSFTSVTSCRISAELMLRIKMLVSAPDILFGSGLVRPRGTRVRARRLRAPPDRDPSASVPDHRREVSSATMSAADCVCRASATSCPAHIESASMSPVVPIMGGAPS